MQTRLRGLRWWRERAHLFHDNVGAGAEAAREDLLVLGDRRNHLLTTCEASAFYQQRRGTRCLRMTAVVTSPKPYSWAASSQ